MRDDLDIPYVGHTATMAEPFGRAGYGTRQSGLDPNTKRMAIIAGGIGGALLVMVGVWSAMAPHRAGTPVIEADARPVRERPVNKGGLSVVGADESSLGAEVEGKAVVAPSPEAPALAALKAAPPSIAAAAVAASPGEAAKADAPAGAAASLPREVPPAALAPAVKPPAANAPASNAPVPASAKPAAPPATVAAAAAPAAAVHAAPPTAASLPAAGGVQVQLAAVASEQAAQSEWQRLSRKFPDLLGNRHLVTSHVERDGKTYWRVRTSGFADAAGATAFCAQIKAKGAACSVASF